MEAWKRPIWRVPLVLAALGLLCRILTLILGIAWGRIQIAQGPGPDGAYTLTTGYLSEIMAVVSFLLFWLAGWRFVRGLTRREVFRSASVMVLVHAALLAAEQVSQRMLGAYSMLVYRLWAVTEGTAWVDRIFLRLFRAAGSSSILWVVPGILAPYFYLVFGKKERA